MTGPARERTTVAVIFGGVSSEHEISCLTAGGVVRAIDDSRFEVVGIGITRSGRWVRVPVDKVAALDVTDGVLPEVPDDLPEAILLKSGETVEVATRRADHLCEVVTVDVAFALLHGPFGEDGTIQGLFEMLGLRYVGAGVAASAIGMDKDLMKRSMAAGGLPVGPWLAFTARGWDRDPAAAASRVSEELGYPVFVKPARGGSSIGITKVQRREDLDAAVEEARRYDRKIVIEAGFVGFREIEVAVIEGAGGSEPRVSLPGEIQLHTDGFYDFESKYLPRGQVDLKVPAELPTEAIEEVRQLAGRTFDVMDVEGLARVDLFWSAEQGGAFVNELNTMPGFTRHSMFPMMWQASGLDYQGLITTLIDLALSRPAGLH